MKAEFPFIIPRPEDGEFHDGIATLSCQIAYASAYGTAATPRSARHILLGGLLQRADGRSRSRILDDIGERVRPAAVAEHAQSLLQVRLRRNCRQVLIARCWLANPRTKLQLVNYLIDWRTRQDSNL